MIEQPPSISRSARSALIERFFGAYRHHAALDPDLYPPLRSGRLTQGNYRTLEQSLGFRLPWSFKEWHRLFHSDQPIEVASVSLPLSPARNAIAHLAGELLDMNDGEELLPHRLLPFGYSEATGEVLAFDARVSREDDEYPIVAFDHEYAVPQILSRIEPAHSHFCDLLVGLTNYLESDMAHGA